MTLKMPMEPFQKYLYWQMPPKRGEEQSQECHTQANNRRPNQEHCQIALVIFIPLFDFIPHKKTPKQNSRDYIINLTVWVKYEHIFDIE